MNREAQARQFHVVPEPAVRQVLERSTQQIERIVRHAYELHAVGDALNPSSHFLRFPQKPSTRIIALPAYVGGEFDRAGIKWIASFPANHRFGLPRASAVLILNDYETGFPIACLEGAVISATRTAFSAAIAADLLTPWAGRTTPAVGVVGAGVIARATLSAMSALGWRAGRLLVCDSDEQRARSLAEQMGPELEAAGTVGTLEEVLRGADVIVLATTVLSPNITDPALLDHCPTVLHISLRDVDVGVVLRCQNVVDDIDHCLTASTSVHLAEQVVQHRRFISGTLPNLMTQTISADRTRPRLFSPFGLGILDVALGSFVLDRCVEDGTAVPIDSFFGQSGG